METLKEIIDAKEPELDAASDDLLLSEVAPSPAAGPVAAPISTPESLGGGVDLADSLSADTAPESISIDQPTILANVAPAPVAPAPAPVAPAPPITEIGPGVRVGRPGDARRLRDEWINSEQFSTAVSSGNLTAASHPGAPERLREQAHYMKGIVIPGIHGGWSIVDPTTKQPIKNRGGLADMRTARKHSKLMKLKESDPVKYMRHIGKENQKLARKLKKNGQHLPAAMHWIAYQRGVDVSEVREEDPFVQLLAFPQKYHKQVPVGGRARIHRGRIRRGPASFFTVFDHDAFARDQQHFNTIKDQQIPLTEHEKWMKSMMPGAAGFDSASRSIAAELTAAQNQIKFANDAESNWSPLEKRHRLIADEAHNKDFHARMKETRDTLARLKVELEASGLDQSRVSREVKRARKLLSGEDPMLRGAIAKAEAVLAELREREKQQGVTLNTDDLKRRAAAEGVIMDSQNQLDNLRKFLVTHGDPEQSVALMKQIGERDTILKEMQKSLTASKRMACR